MAPSPLHNPPLPHVPRTPTARASCANIRAAEDDAQASLTKFMFVLRTKLSKELRTKTTQEVIDLGGDLGAFIERQVQAAVDAHMSTVLADPDLAGAPRQGPGTVTRTAKKGSRTQGLTRHLPYVTANNRKGGAGGGQGGAGGGRTGGGAGGSRLLPAEGATTTTAATTTTTSGSGRYPRPNELLFSANKSRFVYPKGVLGGVVGVVEPLRAVAALLGVEEGRREQLAAKLEEVLRRLKDAEGEGDGEGDGDGRS